MTDMPNKQKLFKEGEDTTWGWVNALNKEELQDGSYIGMPLVFF